MPQISTLEMSTPRFFLSGESIDHHKSRVVITNPCVVNQIARVLRLKVNDKLNILDGQGNIYHCQIESIKSSQAELCLLDRQVASGDPEVSTSIALSLIKSDRFEWAIEKLTELGVKRIIPIICNRTVVKHKSKTRLARWQTIARESSEQCERATIPQVVNPIELERFLTENSPSPVLTSQLRFICAERYDAPFLHDLLPERVKDTVPLSNLVVIIGPEGGFTESELQLAIVHGYQPTSLGRRILRSETAAMYALAQIISVCGGL